MAGQMKRFTRNTARTTSPLFETSRELVEPGLRAAVARLPERLGIIAGYHLGWLDAGGEHVTAGKGKAIRSTLTLCAASSAGGSPAAAVPAAVAIELVHNYSLLHDDVMDGDVLRRHRPAAWSVFGEAEAILTGNALLGQAFSSLAPLGAAAVDLLAHTVGEMCLGQMQDLSFVGRQDVSLDECESMVVGKTGVLLAAACALGALSAGASAEVTAALSRFGERIGVAFQIADDALGVWGASTRTGKPARSDLISRKLSSPVVAALSSGSTASDELAELYFGASDEQVDVERIADLVDAAGGRIWAADRAAVEVEAALSALDLVAGGATDSLRELARTLVDLDALV